MSAKETSEVTLARFAGEGRGEGLHARPPRYRPLTLTLSPTKTWWRGNIFCRRRASRYVIHGLPTYLLVQSTPSLFEGAWASLTMPAPVAKLMTFCHPAALMVPQAGIALATIL